MNFLHKDLGHLVNGSVVVVTVDKAANVKLLDDPNFQAYRSGARHKYLGGKALRSSVRIPVPTSGRWHVTLDFGGRSGSLRHSISVLQPN